MYINQEVACLATLELVWDFMGDLELILRNLNAVSEFTSGLHLDGSYTPFKMHTDVYRCIQMETDVYTCIEEHRNSIGIA